MSMESRLAASTNPHVLTTTASALSASSTTFQPAPVSRAASSSESTSLRAQPRVTKATLRPAWMGVTLGELNVAAGLDRHVSDVAGGLRRTEVVVVRDQLHSGRVADDQAQTLRVAEDLGLTRVQQALEEQPAGEVLDLQPGPPAADADQSGGDVARHDGHRRWRRRRAARR